MGASRGDGCRVTPGLSWTNAVQDTRCNHPRYVDADAAITTGHPPLVSLSEDLRCRSVPYSTVPFIGGSNKLAAEIMTIGVYRACRCSSYGTVPFCNLQRLPLGIDV